MRLQRLVVSVFLTVPGLFAQAQYGSIGGRAADSSGAVIPGVAIAVTNAETGQSVRVASGPDGSFLVPQLLPGTYEIRVEHTGFKRLQVSGIRVEINQAVTQDLLLEVGAVTESVTVQSTAAMVDTVSGSVGHVVENKEILELPLNGRNDFDLVSLTPTAFMQGGAASIGGGRMNSAAAMLDGVTNSRGGLGIQNIELNPPLDAMQEFRLEANGYPAQYGRSNAGIVNATTRSGTNGFHGVLFEFVRNDDFDSRAWSADRKSPLRRNQFGGSIGGPIRRNRSFFFYNYDGFRERRGVVRTRTVPLAAWRAGDFSGLERSVLTPAGPTGQRLLLYDPATGSQQPFAGNMITPDRLDPVARKALSLLPLPNRAPDNPITQTGNWQENSVNAVNRDQHTLRVDHSVGERTQIFGRFIRSNPDGSATKATAGFGDADPDALSLSNQRTNLVLSFSRILSPSAFLTVRGGAIGVAISRLGSGAGENWPAGLGLLGVQPDVFPRFIMSNGLVPTTDIGSPGNQNVRAEAKTRELHADFHLVRGAHAVAFGGSWFGFHGDGVSRKFASGQFGFQTRATQGRTATGSPIANSGVTLGDFLLGVLDQVNVAYSKEVHKRSQYWAGYAQDDWRVSRSLTLNLGIRYEVESPVTETNGALTNFDPWTPNPLAGRQDVPAGVTGVITFQQRNGEGRYLWDWDRNNFSPRFGFAWKMPGGGEQVLRGGFGLLYGNPYDRGVLDNSRPGFDAAATYRTPVPFRLSQGLPANALAFPSDAELTPAFGVRGTPWALSSLEFFDPRRRTQYSFSYNLTFQRQWKQVLFEAGYLANLGRKINQPAININQIPPELLARTDLPERLRRPFPQFASDRPQINLWAAGWGISNYHALAVKSERRFSGGYGWIVSYAWSKWIDNIPATGGDAVTLGDDDMIQNLFDRRGERSLSTNHVPHRLVAAPILELPVGRGRRWLNRGGAADLLAGGWEVSTIGTVQSGSPFGVAVANGGTILGDPAADRTLRPNIAGVMELPASLKGKPAPADRGIQWFNPDAFAVPARFTFGNAARTLMLGPGVVRFDLGVMKNFRFREGCRLQFRWESFNAFNTPQFDAPGSSLGTAGFGIAMAGNSDREMQFGLKLYF